MDGLTETIWIFMRLSVSRIHYAQKAYFVCVCVYVIDLLFDANNSSCLAKIYQMAAQFGL